LQAVRFDCVLKPQFQHMKAEGKPGKTALMSCMRKLRHYLNSLMNPNKAHNPTEPQ
jgi:hypothetical protein